MKNQSYNPILFEEWLFFIDRIRMLHRSAVVIFGIVAMETSSILYVNYPSIIYHYVFAFQSALLVSTFL